ADLLGIEVAVVKAVQAVETGGHGGFVAPGRPMILFEGHIFWRELKKRGLDPERYVAGNENILYPKWEKGHYYGGMKEDERLEKAREIHKEAADASTSWGMFQVMGFNYAMCGYGSVEEMVKDMCVGEDKQLEAFARFVKLAKLHSYLEQKDWVGFARRYNGPGYARNQYDKKLEGAYRKFTKE
ncbi:N-acetylmuramidase family protein, partial [Bacteroides fragilis]|uniref:N-acetylmuramidase family protein n=1 Tax=Bacteroides fragilis TaxID=817 RepID=UPI000453455B